MIRAIVTDIEGTTSALSFVKDVLFPYAARNIDVFLHRHAQEPEVAEQIAAVSAMAGRELTLDEVSAQLQQWIAADRKVTPLKALQGMIWQAGYRNGDFTGHVYADAARQLQAWQQKGLRLYVFSSGSVQAQKLLFAHSDYGDLTPLFSGYFDTTCGSKHDPASYRSIAQTIALPAEEILFLSDMLMELDAAHAAGMHTCMLVREAPPVFVAGHMQAKDFDGINP